MGNGHQAGGNFSETTQLFPEKAIKKACFLSISTKSAPPLAIKP